MAAATTEMLLSDSLGFLDELAPLMMSIEEKFAEKPVYLEKAKQLHVDAQGSIEAWNVRLEDQLVSPDRSWDPSGYYPSVAPRPLRLLRALDEHVNLITTRKCYNGSTYAIKFAIELSNPDLLELLLYLCDSKEWDTTGYLRSACFSYKVGHINVLMNDGRCDLQKVYGQLINSWKFEMGATEPECAAILETFKRHGCVSQLPKWNQAISKLLL